MAKQLSTHSIKQIIFFQESTGSKKTTNSEKIAYRTFLVLLRTAYLS